MTRRSAISEAARALEDAAKESTTARQRILDEASDLTHNARNKDYGNPEDNFANIAKAWTAYLQARYPNVVITPQDYAVMHILVKTARLSTNLNHHDSTVDIAGYAACLGDVQEKSKNGITHCMPNGEAPLFRMSVQGGETPAQVINEQTKGSLRR